MDFFFCFNNFPLVLLKKIVLLKKDLYLYSSLVVRNFGIKKLFFHFSFFIFLFFGVYLFEVSILRLNHVFATENSSTEKGTENPILKEAVSSSSELYESKKKDEGRKTNVEKLEITGTRIRQIDVETFYPIQSFDQEYLGQTGATRLTDALRESPFALTGISREYVLNIGSGAGGGKFLLNGVRNSYVDLSSIPLSLIERVDYLQLGTLGNYGVSSVINIITKKNTTKGSISIQYDYPFSVAREGIKSVSGSRFVIGAHKGIQINPWWNVTGALSFRTSEVIDAKDRAYSRPNMSSKGTGYPGSIKDESDKWFAHPECPEKYILSLPDGGRECNADVTIFGADLIPYSHQAGGLLNSVIEFNDIIFFTEGSFMYRKMENDLAPYAFNWENNGGGEAPFNPFILPEGNGDWSGKTLKDMSQRLIAGSNRVFGVDVFSYNVQSSLDVVFSDKWDGRASMSWSQIYTDALARGVLKKAADAEHPDILDQIIKGEYLPFAPKGQDPGKPALHDKDVTIEENVGSLLAIDLSSSLSLFDWPWKNGGPLLISAFTETQFSKDVKKIPREAKTVFTSAGSAPDSTKQRKYFHSLQGYSKFFPFFEMSLSTGIKHDSSSKDIKFIPQISFRSQITNQVLLRANIEYNKETVSAQDKKAKYVTKGNPHIVDNTRCTLDNVKDKESRKAYCIQSQYLSLIIGNPNLKSPEMFRYHFGGYFQLFEGLTIDVNGWYEINTKLDVPVSLFPTIEEEKGSEALTELGTQIKIEEENKLSKAVGVSKGDLVKQEVIRDKRGQIRRLREVIDNYGESVEYGLTLTLDFKFPKPVFGGHVKVGETFKWDVYNVFRIPSINWEQKQSGLYGSPSWRSRSFVSWKKRSHKINLIGHLVSPVEKFLYQLNEKKHPMYVQFDLSYIFMIPSWKILKGGELKLGVKNIFKQSPSLDFDASNPREIFGHNLYEPRGRVAYVSYQQHF